MAGFAARVGVAAEERRRGAREVEQVRALGVIELQAREIASSTEAEAPAIAPRSSLA